MLLRHRQLNRSIAGGAATATPPPLTRQTLESLRRHPIRSIICWLGVGGHPRLLRLEADRACHGVLLNGAIIGGLLLELEIRVDLLMLVMVLSVAALVKDLGRRACPWSL